MDDDDDGCRKFMVSAIPEDIDVPIICLDDDDDDDPKVDKDYMLFLDNFRDDDDSLDQEDGNDESETRKFDIPSVDSKRLMLGNEKPINNKRVSQQRKRKPIGFVAEFSRAVSSGTTRESIQQRANRVAERRKRKLKVDTLRTASLFMTKEDIQRDNRVAERRKRKLSELKVETLSTTMTEVDIQRANRVAEGRKRKLSELKVGTLRTARRKIDKTKAVETSRVVPMEGVNRVTELKAVDETSRFGLMTESNIVRTRKKNEEESVVVMNKDYISYLKWLVDSLRDLTSKPMENLQNDMSDPDPHSDTLKESTIVPKKDLLVEVKVEQDLESLSDDDDDDAVSDSPLLDGEVTPFLVSKSKIDLEKESTEDESSSRSWFRKNLMDVLEKPYNEEEFVAEFSRAVSLVTTRESIQRANRVAEQRKRKLKVETLRTASLLMTKEDIQRANRVSERRKRKLAELKVETLRTDSLVMIEEDIQQNNMVVERRKRKLSELKVETLRTASLVMTEEDIQRDNVVAERRKKKIDETKAAETSRVVPVEEVNRVTEPKVVDETSRFGLMTQSNIVRTRKKNEEESVVVVDKDYINYLKWHVDSLTDLTYEPMEDLQNDLSDTDLPVPDTRKESTIVPEKDLVKVKVEQELESLSDDDDDDDIMAISDSPLLDGEGTPFVTSKSKIDLEKESTEDESSSRRWFREKLMDVLEKPYNEEEFLMLSGRASMKKPMTRCKGLRKGREYSYETNVFGKSYLEKFSNFDEVYKRMDGNDKARLELLRGFFFYLENISQDGAFRPWTKKLWV